MPSNGMIYAPPHDCACYPEAKVYGFAALAAEPASADTARNQRGIERLERGPAYGKVQLAAQSKPTDWPTYRYDQTRNAYTKTSVPTKLKPKWKQKIEGKLSSVTVADGRRHLTVATKRCVQAAVGVVAHHRKVIIRTIISIPGHDDLPVRLDRYGIATIFTTAEVRGHHTVPIKRDVQISIYRHPTCAEQ